MVKGSGILPTKNILHQIVENAYKKNIIQRIGSFEKLYKTDTMVFYIDRKDKTIIVGIRGTRPTDYDDLEADAMIAFNKLNTTKRFKKDLQEIQEVQQEYLPTQYDYYGVGHSLSGAILDILLDKKIIKYAISYNPAVESKYFRNHNNLRIYNSGDPLYQIMGQFTNNPEIRNRSKSLWDTVINTIPYVGTVYDKLKEHKIESFKGGKKYKQFK